MAGVGRFVLGRLLIGVGLFAAAMLAAAPASHAQFEPGDPQTVSGTLARIKNTGVVRIGYREASIPFSFLDVIKGFRKTGGQVTPIPPGSLQVFPLIAPVMHYEAVDVAGSENEEVPLPGGAVKTQKFKAKRTIESSTDRSVNEAEIWRGDGNTVPFGLVRWTVKTTLERKDATQPRQGYKPVTQTNVEMTAHEWGTGAKSEVTPN